MLKKLLLVLYKFNIFMCLVKGGLINVSRLFAFLDNKLFLSSLSAFRKAIARSNIELPKGQMTHVLRHTFASHYVIRGGNIVKLRDTLGHSEITTTMRYAHLAPDHLEEALELNPLNKHYAPHN